MKGGLRQTTLSQMKFTLAGEESFAEHFLGALQRSAFGEVLLVGYEDIADEIRMIEQINPLVADLEEDDVAIALGGRDEEWETAPRELEQHMPGEPRGGTGRRRPCGHFHANGV